ncbi:hypothetical protein evm_000969 [Chilo suppressalis]|nr:hypothetical protein evm_000969 [Chilo suppressalis]
MKSLILLCIVCLQIGWSYSVPKGVGAYAYEDTAGNRYGGTYGLNDAQVQQRLESFIPPFAYNFQNVDDFFPEYFNNFENILRETFKTNLENQRLAILAATKAYDLTSNQAGYIPNFPTRFDDIGRFGGFPGFPNMMNAAFASGMAGPGFSHQIAAISPPNPLQGNVNVVNRFADVGSPGNGFYSVSSSSFSSSSDVNGKKSNHRQAETIVNNNGHVTEYKVES